MNGLSWSYHYLLKEKVFAILHIINKCLNVHQRKKNKFSFHSEDSQNKNKMLISHKIFCKYLFEAHNWEMEKILPKNFFPG